MVSFAPILPNEIARLASLHSYEILGTPPDERFDLFTRIGTWIFDVPFCGVHFIDDDTTFFKSAIGFHADNQPRKTSICAHAIGLDQAVMAVEDLSRDARFLDHPLVLNKNFRFYAGALLRSSSSTHALGTFCIADVKSRVLSEQDRHKLQELANGVVTVLELHRCNLQLLEAASRDTLTGLFNRHHVETMLHHSVAPGPYRSPFTLMFLDLDQFKPINDTLGHAAGDAVLCEVARRLEAVTCRRDVVARLAGDEFVLMIRDTVDEQAIAHLASRILAAVAAPFAVDGRAVQLSVSIGITLFPRHADTPTDLLHQADIALYDAKRAGRNCFRLYRPTIDPSPRRTIAYVSA